MNEKPPAWSRVVYVLMGVVVGALGWWGVQTLWVHAGELDEQPLPNGVRERLNRNKAEAMDDLLHAMVEGRLDKVEEAAARMEKSKRAVANFLSTESYRQERAIFFNAIDEVREAAGSNDLEATKEATLSLERSCLNCHTQQVNN